MPLAYLITGVLGALVGFSELVSRYRDHPSALVGVFSVWAYILLNCTASVGALYLAQAMGWTFGAQTARGTLALQVVLCSIGAMTIFRSSLFNLKVGNQTVPIGPSTILSLLLSAADRGVDRARGKSRAAQAKKIMNGAPSRKPKRAFLYCASRYSRAQTRRIKPSSGQPFRRWPRGAACRITSSP